MIRFIKWLFTGDAHLHVWVIIREIPMSHNISVGTSYRRFILQCKECGDIKTIDADGL